RDVGGGSISALARGESRGSATTKISRAPTSTTMITCPVTGTEIRLNPAPAFFEGGFRPFFLMAGLYAAFSILAWVPLAHGHYLIETALPLPYWHGHEMVFGFGTAALAGFLLTPLPNWINSGPVRGTRLALLAAVGVAGRI